ncbi:MAG: ABC transporter permease [Terricaulis sp.]|nr:ABC transporter permease [Terricaulis sp.]
MSSLQVIAAQLAKLWAYRWQIWVDITKDMIADSSETAGRFLWVIVLPLVPLGVYIFLAKLRVFAGSDHIDGMVYVVVGATLWYHYTALFLGPMSAIVGKGKVAAQSRYPLAAVVATAAGQAWVEFFMRLVVCAVVMGFLQWPAPLGVVLFFAVALALSLVFLGAGIILAVFTVAFKDVGKLASIAVQYLFFLSNVLFPLPAVIPQWAVWSNPFAFSIDTARWALMFGEVPHLPLLLGFSFAGLLLTLKGLHFLGVAEPRLAGHL